jgi:O-methyltransferase involved in polyketide biosynthesis
VHAVRTTILDSIVNQFIAEQPTAVVLDLGCGLDPRRHRCDPPSGIDWYDLDYPAVIGLRQRFLPEGGHHVGVEIGAPGWLHGIPTDRPAIVVTDGLMALLPDQVFRAMTRAVTSHFPFGQLAFNAYSRLAMRNSRRIRLGPLHMSTAGEGIDDPHEPETWNARLRLIEQLPMAHAPEVARFPPLLRAITRLGARSETLTRHADRVVHYRFDNDDLT